MRKRLKDEKKAEVPIVILVLGVLLLCVIVFINSSSIFSVSKYGDIEDIGTMESCLSYAEQYYFYVNLGGYSLEKIRELPVFKKGEQNMITPDKILICDSPTIKVRYPLN
jgi:hypothetical protein